MSDFMLTQAEGTAHADGAERDISVETSRQINSRTHCLIIEYDVPDNTRGRRNRAFFVKVLNRCDGTMTGLSDNRIVITAWH